MKAQTTVEFFIVFTVIALLSLALIRFYADLSASSGDMSARLSARSTALVLANAIDKISQAGDGASLEIVLPERLSTGETYNIILYGSLRRVELISAARQGAMGIDVPLTTDNLAGARELWGGARVVVKNKEGVVVVST